MILFPVFEFRLRKPNQVIIANGIIRYSVSCLEIGNFILIFLSCCLFSIFFAKVATNVLQLPEGRGFYHKT